MAVLPTGIGPVTGYNIERSLRLNSADSAYLNRTPGSAGNRKTWTWSGWVKRSAITAASSNFFFFAGASGANSNTTYFGLYFSTSDAFAVTGYDQVWRLTTQVFRDPSAWYHIVVSWDTTQSTAANRVKVYLNGSQITSFSSSNDPSLNTDYSVNNTVGHSISGRNPFAASTYFDGYLTEVNFIDGSALTPSDFGETDSATGVWKPKAYTGTYGTNGFYLKFADNSGTTSTTLGKDSSGNGNNWTPNNFSVTAGAGNDSMVDSPTLSGTDTGAGGSVRGNYCTLNPILSSANITFSNGNLDAAVGASSGVYRTAGGTIAISSGKWYFESIAITPFANSCVGVGDVTQSKATWESDTTTNSNFWFVNPLNGNKINGSGASYGSAYSNGDIINCAVDMDNGKIWWGKNGTWFASGDPAAGTNAAYTNLSGKTVTPAYFGGSSASGGATHTANFGQRAFAYTAPSGFKALCTTNLPTPTIGATSTTQANKYFTPYLYTADGTSPKSRTGIGFAPDFLWFKSRSTTFSHALYDQVRGTNKGLQTNTTAAENTYTLLSTFGSDGFTTTTDGTVGNILNDSTNTYVTWCWNAGGSNATNTSGTITSTVRANTTSGFSIVTYTGTGGSGTTTVGHGLGVAPVMVIIKRRSTTGDWSVYHQSLTSTSYYLGLNTTAAQQTYGSTFISPGSSTLTIAADSSLLNTNASTYVAYCFAPVAGYSAFGSYTGNGSADGPFVYLGFRARWILIKSTGASEEHWMLYDTARNTYNVSNTFLMPSASNAELTTRTIDINSNGFKVRDSDTKLNTNAEKYIYAAFAETPFRYSLAR